MSAPTPLIRPPRLRPGDTVAVVAPSGPGSAERLVAGVERLRGWGLEVQVAPHVLDRHDHGYLAGSDADRAADLQAAWLDPHVSAVLCARGGYGAQRMVDLVDWDAMAGAPPRVFAGYSDVTALHEAFAVRLGLVTLHAPMVATRSLVEDEAGAAHLRRTLFEPETVLDLTSATAETLVPGAATGVVVGGCLSLLAGELGTPHARDGASGAIVLLEDTDERRYRVDGHLTHLLRAGWFDGVAGIALGSWEGCEDGVRELVVERLAPLGVPMVWELGFGHGPAPLTVPVGVVATLDADAAVLRLGEPALT